MDWMNSTNPFMGLPAGYTMPGSDPWEPFSTEASVGGFVNPLAPGLSGATGGESTGADDTDRGRAGVDVGAAARKGGNLQSTLKGLQAPAAPQPQRISSPNAPQVRPIQSNLSTLLASMGVSPQQLLRLQESMRRG